MAKDTTPAHAPASVPSASQSHASAAAGSSANSVADDAHTKNGKSVRKASWFRVTVMVLFALIYAWDLYVAVSNLFDKADEVSRLNQVRVLNGFAPLDTPWAFLIANLVLPLVVFALAVLIPRKRNVGILAMTLFAGLGVVAAVSLSITAFVLQLA